MMSRLTTSTFGCPDPTTQFVRLRARRDLAIRTCKANGGDCEEAIRAIRDDFIDGILRIPGVMGETGVIERTVHRALRRHPQRQAAYPDVLANVYFELIKAIHRCWGENINESGSFLGYLSVSTLRWACESVRSEQMPCRHVSLTVDIPDESTTEDQLVAQEFWEIAQRLALDNLHIDRYLRHLKSDSTAAIAKAQGCHESNVTRSIHMARRILRDMFGDEDMFVNES